MNILKEIHNETKERTKHNAIHNNKKIVIIAFTLGILSTIGFYSTGVGLFEDRYADNPLIVSFIVAGIQSVIAFLVSQLVVLYILCFTKTTTLKIINAYERAHNKTVSYSINENLKQIRDDDYVIQINEAKQGLEHQIDTANKRVDVNDYDIQQLKENTERFEPHLARQNRNDYDFNWRLENLEKTINEIKRILVNKKPQNTISLDEYNILHEQLLKAEEELKNLKGE